jgi:GTP-binding protein
MIRGIVAIVGRPNVGKSTLFNRLTRTRDSIVDDRPGVTRDRLYGTVYLDSERSEGFTLIDTGGFATFANADGGFPDDLIGVQTKAAIRESDLVLFLLDSKDGLHPDDRELERFLRKEQKTVIHLVNKIDKPRDDAALADFYKLGVESLHALSSAHGHGVNDLLESVMDHLARLPSTLSSDIPREAPRIALIGRPNVGKSSILNRMVGEDRSLVSDIAGTTRDKIDTLLRYNGKPYVIVDTAGVRRRGKIEDKLESLCVIKSFKAMDNAEVVLLVIDAAEGLTDQDARLAQRAWEQHKALAIVVNKWDLIPHKQTNTQRDAARDLHSRLATLGEIPILFISCLENKRVSTILPLVERLSEMYGKRVETAAVNEILRAAVDEHTPSLTTNKARRVKFFYATQVSAAPPTIVVFSNAANDIQEHYKRYLTKRFRATLGFEEVPLRVIFRERNSDKDE